jgi:hypothetical protein
VDDTFSLSLDDSFLLTVTAQSLLSTGHQALSATVAAIGLISRSVETGKLQSLPSHNFPFLLVRSSPDRPNSAISISLAGCMRLT